MSPTRSRVIAYSIIIALGGLLAFYGQSPIRPSRHGYNELLAIMVGAITVLVGLLGLAFVGASLSVAHPPRGRRRARDRANRALGRRHP